MVRASDLRLYFTALCCIGLMLGLMVSAYLQSMSLFGFALAAAWESLATRQNLPERWNQFKKRPDFWVFGLHFFIVILGAWSIQDWFFWLERLRIKVPFLVLPIAFFFMPTFSTRQYRGLLFLLVLLLSLTSLGILIHYTWYFEDIQLLIKQGQAIPMPSNHIRFSLLTAIGVIAAAELYRSGFYWHTPKERSWIAVLGIFLFVFLHILSVRSGLAALYLAIFVLALRYAWVQRRYGLALGVIGGLMLIPVVGYLALPSFKMKVDYTLYDLRMRQSGQGVMLSDSERLTTLRAGWKVFRASPLLGVGAGNLDQAIHEQYRLHFPQAARVMMPHNQFLYVAAGSGLLGLALFTVALVVPLFFRRHYQDDFFLGTYVVIFTSLLVEATLENAMGVALVTYFLLSSLKQQQSGAPKTAAA